MQGNETVILGIDPGTSIFGYGVIRIRNKQIELIALGSVNLSKYSNHQLKLKYIFERPLCYRSAILWQERPIHVETRSCSRG